MNYLHLLISDEQLYVIKAETPLLKWLVKKGVLVKDWKGKKKMFGTLDMHKEIEKFLAGQLSICSMSHCCGLLNKSSFVYLCGRNQMTAVPLPFCILLLSTCFTETRGTPQYCLSCTVYSYMQFVQFYFYIL